MSFFEGEAVGTDARQQLKTSISTKIVGHHLPDDTNDQNITLALAHVPSEHIGDARTPPRRFLSWCQSWLSRRNPRFCRRFHRWTPDRRYLRRHKPQLRSGGPRKPKLFFYVENNPSANTNGFLCQCGGSALVFNASSALRRLNVIRELNSTFKCSVPHA